MRYKSLLLLLSVAAGRASAQQQQIVQWDNLESDYTFASRLLRNNQQLNIDDKDAQQQSRGDYLSENTLRAYHSYQELALAWRMDNQIYREENRSSLTTEWQFELSELSWAHSFLEQESDLWQIGKFNMPLDPGYALHNLAFFESSADPFDDFSSSEGIKMLSGSIWLQDYYLSAAFALQGQDINYREQRQWAVIVQRDYAALSGSLIMQQYQSSNPGVGSAFTYVSGDSWELHGSAFLRKGSLWLSSNQVLQAHFQDRENAWLPSIMLGSVWSGLANQFIIEWSYQKEKLSDTEITQLRQISTPPGEADMMLVADPASFQKAIMDLHRQRYQQQYLFVQYRYQVEDHSITVNSLIGQDQSALSQFKYEYLSGDNLAYWISLDLKSGSEQGEFKQIPWQSRVELGLQWKI